MSNKSLISYVLEQDLGSNKAGDVIQLESDAAEPLVSAGVLREATAEDVSGADETEDAEDGGVAPVMANSVDRITEKLEKTIAKAVREEVRKSAKPVGKAPNLTTPATYNKPVFDNMAGMIRCMVHAHKGNYGAQDRMRDWCSQTKSINGHLVSGAQYKSAGHNETTAADGGYAVPEEWAKSIYEKVRPELRLLDRCTQVTASSDTLRVPYENDTSRVDGSRQLRGYLKAEGASFTSSKTVLGEMVLQPYKVQVLTYITNELLSDNAYNFQDYLQRKAGQEIVFKWNDYVLNGAGTTEPKGVLAQSSLIQVAKESGQTTTSNPILYANLAKMYSRLHVGSVGKEVWMGHPSTRSYLMQLTYTSGGTSPAWGLQYDASMPFKFSIFGAPFLAVEQCAAVGSVGDLICADLSQMYAFIKPLQVAISEHINFVTDEVAIRFTQRGDLNSPFASAETPFKGTDTTSPFVARAVLGT